jgi:hypothetical protein
MSTVKVTRQEMIEALTRYELAWIGSGNATTKDLMDDCVKFFSKGGFNVWTNEKLLDFYMELQEAAA